MYSLVCLSCLLVLASCRPQMEPYKLEYETDSHARSESGEPGSRVEGSYSYDTPDGRSIKVTYYADDTGYHVESDALPVAPEIPEPVVVEKAAAPVEEVPQEVEEPIVEAPVAAAPPMQNQYNNEKEPVLNYAPVAPFPHYPFGGYYYPYHQPVPYFGRGFTYFVRT